MSTQPCFTIEVVDDCAVIVRPEADFRMEDWPKYVAAYTNVYDTYDHFVLVFDLQKVTLPPVELITKKLDLVKRMRPRTTRQVAGVVVLTPFEVICKIVTQLMVMNGQVSPCYIVSDPREAARAIARMGSLVQNRPGCDPAEVRTLRLGELPFGAFVGLIVLTFLRMQTYYLR